MNRQTLADAYCYANQNHSELIDMAQHDHASEIEKMQQAVLGLTLAWSDLENSMAFFLNSIISQSNYQFGFRVYFAVTSADARFRIVNDSLNELLIKSANTRGNPHSELMAKLWDKVAKRIDTARQKRNDVTHGQILILKHPKSGKESVKLTHYIFHPLHNWQEEPKKSLSLSQVDQVSTNIRQTCSLLVLFSMAVTHIYTCQWEQLLGTLTQIDQQYNVFFGT